MLSGALGGIVMKQVQKMQEDIGRIEKELDGERIEVSSGGGMVKVTITGMGEILGLTIDPVVVDPQEVEMLQDLLVTAVRESLRKAQEVHNERLRGVMPALPPGLNLPGLFG